MTITSDISLKLMFVFPCINGRAGRNNSSTSARAACKVTVGNQNPDIFKILCEEGHITYSLHNRSHINVYKSTVHKIGGQMNVIIRGVKNIIVGTIMEPYTK